LKSLVEKAVAEHGASATPGGMSYLDPAGGLCGQHYAGLYQLKDPTRAAAVTAALQEEVETAITSRGGSIWHDGGGTDSIDDDTGMTHFESGYRLGGRAGTIHGWCTQRGEYWSVVLIFYEMEDAPALSFPRSTPNGGLFP
jgi:hypothetical protein